jgi:hypothetical protein
MPTKNGIEYNLNVSPYKCTWRGLEFFFSSAFHLYKFQDKMESRIEWLNDSMTRRFHFSVEVDYIAVIQLYCQVETRGFLIYDVNKSRWYDCRENITLRGMTISANA